MEKKIFKFQTRTIYIKVKNNFSRNGTIFIQAAATLRNLNQKTNVLCKELSNIED